MSNTHLFCVPSFETHASGWAFFLYEKELVQPLYALVGKQAESLQ